MLFRNSIDLTWNFESGIESFSCTLAFGKQTHFREKNIFANVFFTHIGRPLNFWFPKQRRQDLLFELNIMKEAKIPS